MKRKQAKPFLKWAGGKTQLLGDIEEAVPFSREDAFDYVEPFVGSGAVLFRILNDYPNIGKAVINDINKDLVNCYRTIKGDVLSLIEILRDFENEYNSAPFNSEKRKKIYYAKRNLYNERSSGRTVQSALFIFLNRTCFNGLYRVNKNNEFNVPQGRYKNPEICNHENLLAVSARLKKVTILNTDFTKTEKYAGPGAVFYFDPPYKPLSETSSFTSYANGGFDDSEQVRLKEFCDSLNHQNATWILSNSDVRGVDPENHFFDDLYRDYSIKRVYARRAINVNPEKRGRLTELLITNGT